MYLDYYKELLPKVPKFLSKYLEVPSLVRLKKIGYFCGMDYASKDVYDFLEYITRYDHSLTVALLTYKLTKNKKATIAGLFHDVATPCFSHVIDYMNKDFSKQESTEAYTEEVLRNDKVLLECLEKDKISIDDIVDFKKYSVVDCDRPRMCVDRLDGIILTGISWCRNIELDDIRRIIGSVSLYRNEEGRDEVGFNDEDVCKRVIEINEAIDVLCHSSADNYMMCLLGDIVKLGIDNKLFSYEDLYKFNEDELFEILNNCCVEEICLLLDKFYNITINDIPETIISEVKRRVINPLVLGKRIL